MTTTITSEIEIRFRCMGLKGKDLLSKSDPFLVLSTSVHGQWRELGRTETIQNSHDPAFNKPFLLDYYFEEVQSLRAQVYDRDGDSEDLSRHDFLGHVEFTLGRLMGSPGQVMTLNLQDMKRQGSSPTGSNKLGQIEIRAEELATCADILQLQFSATKVDNKDGFFSKSDP